MTKQFNDVFVITGPAFLPSEADVDDKKVKRFVKYPCLNLVCHVFDGN